MESFLKKNIICDFNAAYKIEKKFRYLFFVLVIKKKQLYIKLMRITISFRNHLKKHSLSRPFFFSQVYSQGRIVCNVWCIIISYYQVGTGWLVAVQSPLRLLFNPHLGCQGPLDRTQLWYSKYKIICMYQLPDIITVNNVI